jgi:alanyl-tRNA synthetase
LFTTCRRPPHREPRPSIERKKSTAEAQRDAEENAEKMLLRTWNKTERLYYDDPYLVEFDARIVDRIPLQDRFGVVLDRTAFYPTSGGQPNDLGTINGIPLLDVYEHETSGDVVHVAAGPVQEDAVHGCIDIQRRRDHMQQHSGQHVLSQAFVELFNWPTVSFHLGAAASTIDLPVESITRAQAGEAEELANRVIRDNRPVAVRYVNAENVAEEGLRKPTQRAGDVRVIDISGFDKSACGGTHVRTTGEIGAILITRIERAKKQTRIEFLCGGRVLRYARGANRTLETISQTISAPPLETGRAVKALWDDLQGSRKRIEELESRLLDYEAAEFEVKEGFAVAVFNGRGIDPLKLLAQKISARPGVVVLLADESDQVRVVFARSADASTDVAVLLKQTLEKFGGRGGGKANLAQGGGLSGATAGAMLEWARQSALKMTGDR